MVVVRLVMPIVAYFFFVSWLSTSFPVFVASALTHLLLWLEVLRNPGRNDQQALIVVTLVHMCRGDLASPHAELPRAG